MFLEQFLTTTFIAYNSHESLLVNWYTNQQNICTLVDLYKVVLSKYNSVDGARPSAAKWYRIRSCSANNTVDFGASLFVQKITFWYASKKRFVCAFEHDF